MELVCVHKENKMTDTVIVYRSKAEQEMAELSHEMFMDFGAWLCIWVPVFLKWYFIVALLVAVIYEVVTTVKDGRFNGIKDGLTAGLGWPIFIYWAVAPLFKTVFSGKKLKWERW
jgi:hypothetical protein